MSHGTPTLTSTSTSIASNNEANTNSPLSSASTFTSYKNTSHKFIPRYTGPTPSQMTTEQTTIYESILKSRPRTGISGPFGPWLAIPHMADPAQQLGTTCRYHTSLSFRESELVILLTAARHGSHAEFDIHRGEALKAGIDWRILDAIPRDDKFSAKAVEQNVLPPLGMECKREVELVKFAAELLETSTVGDEAYASARDTLGGDEVLVEVTGIVGYYTLCAYTLNVFRIPTNKLQGEEQGQK